MKVAIVGDGCRESALEWVFGKCGHDLAKVPTSDVDSLFDAKPDLTVIGPEQPLKDGLADRLREQGLTVFGPGAKSAQLESSKWFGYEFAKRNGVPVPHTEKIDISGEKDQFPESLMESFLDHRNVVLKFDGLASGKGVRLLDFEYDVTPKMFMNDINAIRSLGKEVLSQERLKGEEYSVHVVLHKDGSYTILPPVKDKKTDLYGKMTGGIKSESAKTKLGPIKKDIIDPTLNGLKKEGLWYCGVLYFGVIETCKGVYLLEYNVRFGDPEVCVLAKVIGYGLLNRLIRKSVGLSDSPCPSSIWTINKHRKTVALVICAENYPEPSSTGDLINLKVLSKIQNKFPEAIVFFGAVTQIGDEYFTNGGRVMTVVLPSQERLSFHFYFPHEERNGMCLFRGAKIGT
jgi:phosphoribosylamine-glycine ligase